MERFNQGFITNTMKNLLKRYPNPPVLLPQPEQEQNETLKYILKEIDYIKDTQAILVDLIQQVVKFLVEKFQ